MEWLRDLQNKSEQERRVVLWIATLVIFGVIFLIWISTFSLPDTNADKVEKAEETYEVSPLDSLKDMSSGVFRDIKRGYGVFKGEITELGEEEGGEVGDDTSEALIPDIAASDRGFNEDTAASSTETYDMMDDTQDMEEEATSTTEE